MRSRAFTPVARKLRLLIVEDHPLTRELTMRQLHDAGIKDCAIAEDGLQAIEKVEQATMLGAPGYDAILMDIQMPKLDGIRATTAIRNMERRAGKHRSLIFALTANPYLTSLREECLAVGMDAFLHKPLDTDTFLDEVLARTNSD